MNPTPNPSPFTGRGRHEAEPEFLCKAELDVFVKWLLPALNPGATASGSVFVLAHPQPGSSGKRAGETSSSRPALCLFALGIVYLLLEFATARLFLAAVQSPSSTGCLHWRAWSQLQPPADFSHSPDSAFAPRRHRSRSVHQDRPQRRAA